MICPWGGGERPTPTATAAQGQGSPLQAAPGDPGRLPPAGCAPAATQPPPGRRRQGGREASAGGRGGSCLPGRVPLFRLAAMGEKESSSGRHKATCSMVLNHLASTLQQEPRVPWGERKAGARRAPARNSRKAAWSLEGGHQPALGLSLGWLLLHINPEPGTRTAPDTHRPRRSQPVCKARVQLGAKAPLQGGPLCPLPRSPPDLLTMSWQAEMHQGGVLVFVHLFCGALFFSSTTQTWLTNASARRVCNPV